MFRASLQLTYFIVAGTQVHVNSIEYPSPHSIPTADQASLGQAAFQLRRLHKGLNHIIEQLEVIY